MAEHGAVVADIPVGVRLRVWGRGQVARSGGQTVGRATSTATTRAHPAAGRNDPRRLGPAGRPDDRVGPARPRPPHAAVAGRHRRRRRPERHRCIHRPLLGAGRALPLRPPGAHRLFPRRQRRLQAPALRALPRSGQAVEPLGGRRLAHGTPGLQRGAPGDDLERARAGDGPCQRPRDLRTGATLGPPPVQPGRVRPLRAAAADDREPAGAVPHPRHPRHAPGRLQPDVRRRGRTVVGRVHRRRAECGRSGALVARVRHEGGRHRVPPLLGQRRPRRPAGRVRPRLG